MYENEIRSIAEYSIRKIKPLGNTFTFELLSNSDIHPALIQYISAEMDYMIYRERQKLLLESYFDYGDKELTPFFNKIGAIVKRKKELPLEDVSRLIRQAAAMNINFLLRPKWTLMKLIYNNVDVRTTDEIRILLNYTHFYTYIKKIVGTIFDIKKETSFTQKSFSDLMDNLFEEMVASQRRYIVENGIDAMSDFYNIGKGDSTRLPVGMVETFLGEKNLTELADKLRNVLSPEGDAKFDAEVYKDVLFSGTPAAPDDYKPYEPDPNENTLPELDLPESKSEEEVIEEITREEKEEPEEQPQPDESEDDGPPKLEGLKQFSDEFYYSKADDDEEPEEELKEEQPVKPAVENTQEASVFRETIEMNFLEPEDYEKYLEGDDLDIQYTKVESGIGEEKTEPVEKEPAADNTGDETPPVNEELTEEEPDEEDTVEEVELDDDDMVLKLEDLDSAPEEEDTDVEDIADAIDEETEETAEVDLTEEEPELEDEEREEEIESTEAEPERDAIEEAEMMKDIFGYFDTSETMKVINNFFNEDHVDFVNTMEKIAVADNFEEAEKILDLVYKGAGMSPGNKLSKMLRERVKRYFREKD